MNDEPIQQDEAEGDSPSRRKVLKAGVVGAAGIGLVAAGLTATNSPAFADLTPMCVDHDDTPSNVEGPFFKRTSPLRTNLVTAGVTGVLLSLKGTVYNESCQPVS